MVSAGHLFDERNEVRRGIALVVGADAPVQRPRTPIGPLPCSDPQLPGPWPHLPHRACSLASSRPSLSGDPVDAIHREMFKPNARCIGRTGNDASVWWQRTIAELPRN